MDHVCDTLQEIGLKKNEAKIYSALLEIGSATVGKIAKKSKIHRTNVYDSLEKMVQKGLVSYVLKNKTKHYQATHPENLFLMLNEKRAKLQDILPQLHFSHNAEKSRVSVYEGKQAIKNILNRFLEKKLPIDVLGIPKEAILALEYFIPGYHRKRIKRKIAMRHIYNSNAQDRIEWLNKQPLTEARFLPKEYNSPVSTNICGEEVVFILWGQTPIVIQIEDKEIASSYQKYFELLWKLGKHHALLAEH